MTSQRKTKQLRAKLDRVADHLRRQHFQLIGLVAVLAVSACMLFANDAAEPAIVLAMCAILLMPRVVWPLMPPEADASHQAKSDFLRRWTKLEFDGETLLYQWGQKPEDVARYPLCGIRRAVVRRNAITLQLYKPRWYERVVPPRIGLKLYDPQETQEFVRILLDRLDGSRPVEVQLP